MKGSFDDTNDSSLANTSGKLSTGKSAPLTRKQKANLATANDVPDVVIEDVDSSVEQKLQTHFNLIHSEVDADEDAEAIERVNEVIPAFLDWRLSQSPKRIAAKVDQYAEEVTEEWRSKFQDHSEKLRTSGSKASAEILSKFTSGEL